MLTDSMGNILSCIPGYDILRWYVNLKGEYSNLEKLHFKLQAEYIKLSSKNVQLQQELYNGNQKYQNSEFQLKTMLERLNNIEKENSLNRISGSNSDDIRNPSEFHRLFSSVNNAIRVYCKKVEKHEANADNFKYFNEIFKLYDEFDAKNSLLALVYACFFLDFENPSFTYGGSTMHCEKREETFIKKFVILNETIDDDDEIINKNKELNVFFHKIYNSLVNAILNFNPLMPFEVAKSILFDSDSAVNAFKHAVQEVWKLHCFSFAFSPPVEIIRAFRYETFKSSEVEIASLGKGTKVDEEVQVSFMISPGFKIAKRKNLVVKPLVCLV